MPPPAQAPGTSLTQPVPHGAETTSGRFFAPIDFKNRFPALDGLRALAVTIVFVHHYGGGSHGGLVLRVINTLRLQGWVGVDLFFVLSGFLITGILFDTRSDSRFFYRFFARRSLRIFPVFYLVFAVLLLLTPVLHYQWRAGHLLFLVYMGNFLGNYNFDYYTVVSANHPAWTAQLSHFWSLCIEEQFYLIWPFVVWLVRDRVRLLWIGAVTVVAVLLLRTWFYAHFGMEIGDRWAVRTLPFRIDTLLVGGILALVLRGPHADRWQRACRWLFLGSLAAFALVIYQLGLGMTPALMSLRLTAIALCSAGLIGITLRKDSPAFRFFNLRPLRFLGRYSYGFYIFHYLFSPLWLAILIFFEQRLHSLALAGLLTLSANFALTLLAAVLSYDLFEVKFLRYKRHFEYDSELRTHTHAFETRN